MSSLKPEFENKARGFLAALQEKKSESASEKFDLAEKRNLFQNALYSFLSPSGFSHHSFLSLKKECSLDDYFELGISADELDEFIKLAAINDSCSAYSRVQRDYAEQDPTESCYNLSSFEHLLVPFDQVRKILSEANIDIQETEINPDEFLSRENDIALKAALWIKDNVDCPYFPPTVYDISQLPVMLQRAGKSYSDIGITQEIYQEILIRKMKDDIQKRLDVSKNPEDERLFHSSGYIKYVPNMAEILKKTNLTWNEIGFTSEQMDALDKSLKKDYVRFRVIGGLWYGEARIRDYNLAKLMEGQGFHSGMSKDTTPSTQDLSEAVRSMIEYNLSFADVFSGAELTFIQKSVKESGKLQNLAVVFSLMDKKGPS